MMLEAALRFGRQAQRMWDDPARQVEAGGLVRRALDIVEELTRSVAGGRTEISKRLEEEYAYAFRALSSAQMGGDAAQLEAALTLLAFHRESWRQACEKLRSTPAPTPHLVYDIAAGAGFSFQA